MKARAALVLVLLSACGPGEGATPEPPIVKSKAADGTAPERLKRGTSLLAQERLAEAAAEFRAVLLQDPKSVPALEGLSRIAARMNDAPASLGFLQRAADLKPDDASIVNQLGVAYVSNGRRKEAAAVFDRALALNPRDPFACLNAAQNQADLGDWDRARRHAEAAAAILPADATPWLLMGRFQMRQGKFAEAIAPLREAAKRAPDQALVQYNLGKALASAGRRQEAEEPLRAALKGNPPEDVRKEVEALLR
jgi:tetratricopeptide (TPR) repeat protein